jgi:predicted permease
MKMTGLWNDVRLALRGLFRAPGFTAITIGTLALGIGATTTIFTVVNGVLLKPLPFDDPDELVGVWHKILDHDVFALTPPQYFTYRDENRVFEDIGSWNTGPVSVTGLTEPEQVLATWMTAGLLPLLRAQPAMGRRFAEEDDSPGAPQTIMLSYAYWQRRLGADPAVLGSSLRVDGTRREIIGVLPPDFVLPGPEAAIYYPVQWDPLDLVGDFTAAQAIARLLPGATIEQAHADVERMLPIGLGRTRAENELSPNPIRASLRPLKQDYVGDIGSVLWVLLGSVGIVLLIACANVANLFLVRSEGRQQEVAVRTALGAGRGQIARQFLLESLVLGLLGGLVGLGLGFGGVRLLKWLGPETLPRINEIAVDPTVLGFALGISLFSGLLFGLFPVFRVGGLDLVSSLKEGGWGGSVGKQRHRARNTLVVAQMALALVLLAGSGLMIRSFQALRTVDPGFANPEEVLTFRVAIPEAETEDDAEVAVAYEDMWRRLQEIPGVTSVGASSSFIMDDITGGAGPVIVEESPRLAGQRAPFVYRWEWVSEDYFEAMQNPVLAGRSIEWSDIHDRTPVAVVTENFAEYYWGSAAAALGKRISTEQSVMVWQEVIGVVGNVRDDGLSGSPTYMVFWPMAAANIRDFDLRVQRTMAFAVRTSRSDPFSLLPEARAAIWAVNPNLPLANVSTLDKILAQSPVMARTSFTLVMLAIAAAVALALGVVGIYAVISYIMSQRTREIGVRMALGADRRDVSRMVLRQGMILAGIGVAVGVVAAVGLTRFLSSLLYGVEATDPFTFGAVAAMLVAVALVASYLPALRASRTDPLEALRFE